MKTNMVQVLIGILALGYGLYTAYVQIKSPEKFGKLESMKRVYGDRAGKIIHFLLYTLIPIGFGLYLIATGLPYFPLNR